MTSVFQPRTEILPPAQLRLWPELRGLTAAGFTLYGGTAIALRLGHRQSVDFDFFINEPLDREGLRAAAPWLATSRILQDRLNTYTVLTGAEVGSVKVSFFGGLDFGRLEDPQLTADGTLRVASLDDLLALKLKVLLQRIEAKDYLDISAIVASGADLGRGLAGAQALFGRSFAPAEAVKALVHFKGGDLDTLNDACKQQLIAAATAARRLPAVSIRSHSLNVER